MAASFMRRVRLFPLVHSCGSFISAVLSLEHSCSSTTPSGYIVLAVFSSELACPLPTIWKTFVARGLGGSSRGSERETIDHFQGKRSIQLKFFLIHSKTYLALGFYQMRKGVGSLLYPANPCVTVPRETYIRTRIWGLIPQSRFVMEIIQQKI